MINYCHSLIKNYYNFEIDQFSVGSLIHIGLIRKFPVMGRLIITTAQHISAPPVIEKNIYIAPIVQKVTRRFSRQRDEFLEIV